MHEAGDIFKHLLNGDFDLQAVSESNVLTKLRDSIKQYNTDLEG